MSERERRGCCEIRWTTDGDPDDVVAPWPSAHAGAPVTVHVERMEDGVVWMNIHEEHTKTDVHMWLTAEKKGVLRWSVSSPDPGDLPHDPPLNEMGC